MKQSVIDASESDITLIRPTFPLEHANKKIKAAPVELFSDAVVDLFPQAVVEVEAQDKPETRGRKTKAAASGGGGASSKHKFEHMIHPQLLLPEEKPNKAAGPKAKPKAKGPKAKGKRSRPDQTAGADLN